MRKWQDLAAPDDPNSWYAISNMWPTKRGTYEAADTSTSTEIATAATAAAIYAFAARTLSSSREYVVTPTKIFQYSGGALTDRTGGVAISFPMMAQYGDATICAMGVGAATSSSTGGNFAALAGSPNGEIVVICRNAAVIFNTNTSADGWAASDVGDYTNWSTGESASGRIVDSPGEIMAAAVLNNDIIVFKRSAIYRMTYVGGVVKWQVQLAWAGMGCYPVITSNAKYQVAVCASGVAFNGAIANLGTNAASAVSLQIYLFDGSSRPVKLNPLTTLPSGFTTTTAGGTQEAIPVFFYDPVEDILCIANSQGAVYCPFYYYSFQMQAWGSGGGASAESLDSFGVAFTTGCGVLQGDYYAQPATSSRPAFYIYGTTNAKLRRCVPSAPAATFTCSLQTSMRGRSDRKTNWSRCTPQLRRRTDLGSGSVSLALTLFREREDTSAASSQTITESTQRKRFDFTGTDNFARFNVTWTNFDPEIDDFLIKEKDAGED